MHEKVCCHSLRTPCSLGILPLLTTYKVHALAVIVRAMYVEQLLTVFYKCDCIAQMTIVLSLKVGLLF